MQKIAYVDLLNGVSLNATPIDFNTQITTTEWLMEIQGKFNSVIDAINGWTKESMDYTDERLYEVQQDINKQFTSLTNEVNQQYATMLQRLIYEMNNQKAYIDSNLESNYSKITSEYLEADKKILDILNAKLDEISKFIKDYNMGVFDPTTGDYNAIGTVISNLFDFFRSNAMNVTQLDARTTNATQRDGEKKTAKDLDVGQNADGTTDLSVLSESVNTLMSERTPERKTLTPIESRVSVDGGFFVQGKQVTVQAKITALKSIPAGTSLLNGLPTPAYVDAILTTSGGRQTKVLQSDHLIYSIDGLNQNEVILISGCYIKAYD